MPPTDARAFRFPCRSGWCNARGIALIALWLALVAGFLAQTTMASSPPPGSGTAATAAQCPTKLAPTS